MLRLSRELETTFSLAIKEAKRRRHEYLCLEHILYALTFDEVVAEHHSPLRRQRQSVAARS